jgi:hypothetical protein
MTESVITVAAFAGMIGALLWLGLLPYLLKRREAEQNGQPIPSFSTSYLTSLIISSVGGFVSIVMVIGELENSLVGVTSVLTAAGIGFSFTYSILSISNRLVDLKYDKISLESGKPETTTSTTKA